MIRVGFYCNGGILDFNNISLCIEDKKIYYWNFTFDLIIEKVIVIRLLFDSNCGSELFQFQKKFYTLFSCKKKKNDKKKELIFSQKKNSTLFKCNLYWLVAFGIARGILLNSTMILRIVIRDYL